MNGRVWRGLLGLAALGVFIAIAWPVAKDLLPREKEPFDKYLTGIGPRLWTTWGYLATFAAAVLAFGHLLVRKLLGRAVDGAWGLAFAAGAVSFGCAIGLFGWLGWLGWPFFWLLPLGMLILGARALIEALHELRTSLEAAPGPTLGDVAWWLFGGACLVFLLLQAINPDNVNYDSLWYHLRAADRNAWLGAIERTPEGDMLLALPSLTSWITTWAFLSPTPMDDKVVLALHLELVEVLATLALLPALVRRLVPSIAAHRSRAVWVSLFFFPSLFLYDTGVMGGADHTVALWCAASMLTWFTVREVNSTRAWVFFGIVLAGLSAKYSSLYFLVPFVPVVLVDAWLRAEPALRRRSLALTFVAAGVTLAFTAPYWLRNWVWYHDPIYPSAAGLFGARPWNPDAEAWKRYYTLSNAFDSALGSPRYRVEASFRALYDYHTKIYGWKDMMGGHSIMGSGWFFAMLLIPFVAERRRLVLIAALTSVGIIVWYNTHQPHTRYLTVLTPLMAAGMAAVALSLWDLGIGGRASVLGAVALMLTAYADTPFRKTHRMMHGNSELELASTYIVGRGPGSAKLKTWRDVTQALPAEAKVLVHGIEPHLGLERSTVTDATGLQFGINYARWGSVAETWKQLRLMGVTHLVWRGDVEQPDSVAGEAIFNALAHGTVSQRTVAGLHLGELPADAPPAEPGSKVLYVGCKEMWSSGVYPLAVLAEPMVPLHFPWPKLKGVLQAVAAENYTLALGDPAIGYVVLEEACNFPAPPGWTFMGAQRMSPSGLRYYVR